MKKLEQYNKEKKAALKLAQLILINMQPSSRLQLAAKLGISYPTLYNYKSGNGANYELALKIIEEAE